MEANKFENDGFFFFDTAKAKCEVGKNNRIPHRHYFLAKNKSLLRL